METQPRRRGGRKGSTPKLPDIVDRPFAAAEGRVRESLASAHAEAKKRGRRLARYLAKHPIGCSLVAFAVGLAAARLLQRVD